MKAIMAQHRLVALSKFVIGMVAIPVTLTLLLTGAVAAKSGNHHDTVSLANVRAATARYHNLDVAKANDYALFPDAAGIACIANPGVGAMGIHYVNSTLVGSGTINARTPQALVYEPDEHGHLRLVAVEYITFQQAWDKTHSAPPTLFGQTFMLSPDGNRFGIPAFYSLHVWLWKTNPSGLFAMWNPRVHCDTRAAA